MNYKDILRGSLTSRHALARENEGKWNYYSKAYDGGRDFVREVLIKNDRESMDNYSRRIKEAVCFNYSAAVVNIFNYFLNEKTVHRELGPLENDPQWEQFMANCDLDNTGFEDFMNDRQKVASIHGVCGIFVDKPTTGGMYNRAKEASLGLYPYIVPYTMSDIYDWAHERNPETGRKELIYLKLRIAPKLFSIWTQTHWCILKEGTKKEEITIEDIGENSLGEIPFVFTYNIKSLLNPDLGLSDVVDVSLIQGSITRNISGGDEVINYAAFPMLVVPMENDEAPVGDDEENAGDIVVSARSVLEIDPENPEAKPFWLQAPVLEPIRAILEMIDRKTDEMYRTVHLGGIYSQRDKAQTKSGVALKYEYHQLNSVLKKKARNLTEAEMRIIRFWMMWQGMGDKFHEISITRSEEFNVDELTETLTNIISGINLVQSKEFAKIMRKNIVEKLAPNLTKSQHLKIEKEIEAIVEEAWDKEIIPEPQAKGDEIGKKD